MASDSDNINMAIAMTGQLDYCDGKLTELIGYLLRDYCIVKTERTVRDTAGNAGTVVYVLKVQNSTDKLASYVLDMVVNNTGVTIAEMRNYKIKLHKIVVARDIASFILRYRYNMCFEKIASILGAKCHATIVRACQKFDCSNVERLHFMEGEILFLNAKRRYKKYPRSRREAVTSNHRLS